MSLHPIVIEQYFRAPVSKVWKAISQRDEMKKWYFDLAEFKAVPGFQFQFSGGPTPERQYLHLCEVIDAVPDKTLSYSWQYDGYSGSSTVIFELSEEGGTTLLRLTHEGLETFPGDNPDLARENFVIGWNSIVKVSLKEYLGNTV
jgi:uncharacterized protein YndB with AHSA1/START domain